MKTPNRKTKSSRSSLRLLSLFLALLMLAALPLSLAGCKDKAKPIIGIIQFGTHESLNNCYVGIREGLTAAGIDLEEYDVRYLNSNFDSDLSATQASTLVNLGAKVIIGIATPSAIAAANASAGNIPVVYCAVTDDAIMKAYDNVCGSSDRPNYQKTLELITAAMGREDLNIGVISYTGEASDAVMLADLGEAARAYAGMRITTRYISDISTIGTLTSAMIEDGGVDCFLNLLDNTVVGQLTNILAVTDRAGVPVFGSEIEQVRAGCLAASSIDYLEVGSIAGDMAARILSGSAAGELGCRVVSEPAPCYSEAICVKFGLDAPAIEGIRNVDGQ